MSETFLLSPSDLQSALSDNPDTVTPSSGIFRYSKRNYRAADNLIDLVITDQIKRSDSTKSVPLSIDTPQSLMLKLIVQHKEHKTLTSIVGHKLACYVYHDTREAGEKVPPFIYFYFVP